MQFKILLIFIFCILCFSNVVALADEHISDEYQNVMQSVRKRNIENNILDKKSNSTQVDNSTLAPVPEVISDSDSINEIIKEVSQNVDLYTTILLIAQTIKPDSPKSEYITYINAVEKAIKIDGDITFKSQLQINYIFILEKLGYAYLKTSNFNKAIDVYEKLMLEQPNLIYKKNLVYLYDVIKDCEKAKKYLNDIKLYEPLYVGNLVNCQISNQTSNYNNQITYQQPIVQKQSKESYNINWLIYVILLSIYFANYFSKKDNSNVDETINVKKDNKKVVKEHRTDSYDNFSQTWDDIKDTILKKYGYKCSICGKTNNLQMHHKIPIKDGGTNDLFNLIPLCIDCHEKIHKFKIEDDNYDSTWNDIKDAIYKKYGYKCSICGKTNNLQIHHKIPIKDGGTNDLFNLIPLCKDCHEKIHKFKIGNDNSDIPRNYGFNSKKRNVWIEAINKNIKIKIRYSANKCYKNGEVTERIIIPQKIMLGCEVDNEYVKNSSYDKNKIFVKAFCLLREDYRIFRLDRIKILEILN